LASFCEHGNEPVPYLRMVTGVDQTGQLYPPNAAQTKVESHLTNNQKVYILNK
jgi:hypothetical protein